MLTSTAAIVRTATPTARTVGRRVRHAGVALFAERHRRERVIEDPSGQHRIIEHGLLQPDGADLREPLELVERLDGDRCGKGERRSRRDAEGTPEVAHALLVHIENQFVTGGHIRPEGGQFCQPALALTLAAKAEPLPLGGGCLQQILAFDGPGIGETEGLGIAPRLIAAAFTVEGGVIELEPEPAHLPLPHGAQSLPGCG